MLLNQRRTFDAVPRSQALSRVALRRERPPGLGKVDLAFAAVRGGKRSASAARDALERRLFHRARHARAQTHDLGAFLACAGAVAAQVLLVEAALQCTAVAAAETHVGQLHA